MFQSICRTLESPVHLFALNCLARLESYGRSIKARQLKAEMLRGKILGRVHLRAVFFGKFKKLTARCLVLDRNSEEAKLMKPL